MDMTSRSRVLVVWWRIFHCMMEIACVKAIEDGLSAQDGIKSVSVALLLVYAHSIGYSLAV